MGGLGHLLYALGSPRLAEHLAKINSQLLCMKLSAPSCKYLHVCTSRRDVLLPLSRKAWLKFHQSTDGCVWARIQACTSASERAQPSSPRSARCRVQHGVLGGGRLCGPAAWVGGRLCPLPRTLPDRNPNALAVEMARGRADPWGRGQKAQGFLRVGPERWPPSVLPSKAV